MGGGWLTPRSGRLIPGKESRYPFCKRLGGPQGWSGRVRKISSSPGFDPRNIQPVASRYTDRAIAVYTELESTVDVLLKVSWHACLDTAWRKKKGFLGAFSKLRKASISFVMSVCPYGTTWLPMEGFWRNLKVILFRKIVEKIKIWLKSDKNNGYFTCGCSDIFDDISLNYS
jgi:hypothetical protein